MKNLPKVWLVLCLAAVLSGCGAEKPPAPPAKSVTAQSRAAPVDINRAGKQELMALRGIGEVRAMAIIRGRPFARKDELVQRGIVPLPVYEDIRDQIIARQ